jgi:hypothetical protein
MPLILAEVKKLGPQNVFIGGYERGVSIALSAFLYFDEKLHGGPLGGVFGFAGIFNKEVLDWKHFNIAEKKKTPVFLYHGEDDVFINPRHAVNTYNHLIKNGLNQIKFKCDGKLGYSMTTGMTRELSIFMHDILDKREQSTMSAKCLNSGLGLQEALEKNLFHEPRTAAKEPEPIDDSLIYRVEHVMPKHQSCILHPKEGGH